MRPEGKRLGLQPPDVPVGAAGLVASRTPGSGRCWTLLWLLGIHPIADTRCPELNMGCEDGAWPGPTQAGPARKGQVPISVPRPSHKSGHSGSLPGPGPRRLVLHSALPARGGGGAGRSSWGWGSASAPTQAWAGRGGAGHGRNSEAFIPCPGLAASLRSLHSQRQSARVSGTQRAPQRCRPQRGLV